MVARIFKPAKTAMQSGEARTKEWMLEYAPASPREVDPLMGWTGSRDMRAQVQLAFDTKEDAIAYAEREGIAFQIFEPSPRKDALDAGRTDACTRTRMLDRCRHRCDAQRLNVLRALSRGAGSSKRAAPT